MTMGDAWVADTGPRSRGCSAAELAAATAEIATRYPHARLVRSVVGNLAVLVDGVMVGFLDLTDGRYEPLAAVAARLDVTDPGGTP